MSYYELKLNTLKINSIKANLILKMVKMMVDGEAAPKKRMWVRSFIAKWGQNGHYEKVYNEWRYHDPSMFRTMLRITPEAFKTLLDLVENKISKQVTQMRNPVAADKRLSITLRYLATGKN